MQKEITSLRTRLDDAEDRSGRNNLVFFGIADSILEKWEQTETKVVGLVSERLHLQLSADSTQRADMLGKYVGGENSPINDKFSTHETKELVFSKRSLIAENQYFSFATCMAHEKLKV